MRQWYICLVLFISSAVLADESLTLDQAIIKTLEQSPLIRAADYEAKAAVSRIRQAQQTPAYKASVEFENFGGSGPADSDNLESTLSLSKVLEMGDQSRLRGEVAQNSALLVRNEQDAERLDLLAETAKRFINVVKNQETLVIARDSAKVAEHIRKVVAKRVKAGRTSEAELSQAEIALARSRLNLEHAEHELEASRVKLAISWGETELVYANVAAELFNTKQQKPFSELAQLLELNPDITRYATEQRLAGTRMQLAKAKGRSTIEFTGGVRHFNSTGDTGLVFSLNMPLGTSSRSKANVEEAALLQQLEPHIFEQRKLDLYATLFEVYQEIKHAIDAVTTLREQIIPKARKAFEDYEKGYAAGRYSLLELNQAQSSLLDSRLEAVMAAAEYHHYKIEIDRLTGAGLSSGVNHE